MSCKSEEKKQLVLDLQSSQVICFCITYLKKQQELTKSAFQSRQLNFTFYININKRNESKSRQQQQKSQEKSNGHKREQDKNTRR